MGRLLLICLGGAVGTGVRYLTAVAAAHWLGPDFPYGTLLVNLVGSFLIGLVQEVGLEARAIPDDVRLFLATGLIGGLTTYSAFSYETVRLIQDAAWSRAWINVVVTTSVTLLLCFLGIAAARGLMMLRG